MNTATIKNIFNSIYVLGIFAGMALIYGVYKNNWPDTITFAKGEGMLIIPVLFVVVLFFISLANGGLKKAAEIAGSKIQSAGYLYTLIGVVIAMMQIDGQGYTINDAIAPIGAALLTSLAGWFLGSFVEEQDSSLLAPEVGEAESILATCIKIMNKLTAITGEYETFMERIGEAHNSYIMAVKSGAKEFETIQGQTRQIKEAMEGMKDLSKFLASKDLLEHAKALPTGIKALSNSLQEMGEDSKKYVAGLQQVEVMMEEHIKMLKKLADKIEILR